MSVTRAPSGSELVGRASQAIPTLQKAAIWAEDNRRLSEEAIGALTEAGVPRLRVPAAHGGHEADMLTVVRSLAEIGRGDGSAAWVGAVFAISTWMIGMFPQEVQEEVFATPDVRVSGILSPTAMAVPADGGVVVNGRWAFNSGATQSHWNTNAAMLAHSEDQLEPVMLAIPMAELEIVDDWHTSGLRGTGSVTTIATDVFVPRERVLSMGPVLVGQHPLQADGPAMYRAPFMPIACATVAAPALGLARAALDAFTERLPGRKITYTDYESQSAAPVTHLQVAEASVLIAEAAFHAERAAETVDAKTASGAGWTTMERARARLDLAATCRRAKEAVDLLGAASGGSSIFNSVPIQRIQRDIQAINLHAILNPDTGFELYGRIACGLEPNTLYI